MFKKLLERKESILEKRKEILDAWHIYTKEAWSGMKEVDRSIQVYNKDYLMFPTVHAQSPKYSSVNLQLIFADETLSFRYTQLPSNVYVGGSLTVNLHTVNIFTVEDWDLEFTNVLMEYMNRLTKLI